MSLEECFSLENLYYAYHKCKNGVYWKYSVQRYEYQVIRKLNELRKRILDGTYVQKPFYEFDINERGKKRHIKALHIEDRIVQRCLCDHILVPILSRHLIYDNGASIKGKGIDFTRNRLKCHLEKFVRKHKTGYILLLDYSKYFDSIPHDQLLAKLNKYIKDEQIMALIAHMVRSFGGKRGLGIGSQISQILGSFYLTEIDNYIKIIKGCKYYGRYADDLYIICERKEFLQEILGEISTKSSALGLIVNIKKTRIVSINKTFTFMKRKYFATDTGKIIIRPCSKNMTRERRKLKKWKEMNKRGEMSFEEIRGSYCSWRYNQKGMKCYHVLKNMDALYDSLFKQSTGCVIQPV